MTILEDRKDESATPPPATPPVEPGPERPEAPRSISSRTFDDAFGMFGCLAASLALDWLVYEQLLSSRGPVGFVICWYFAFLGLYAAVSAMGNPRPIVVDRVMQSVIYGAAIIVLAALSSAVIFTFFKGEKSLVHINLYTSDMGGVRPTDPLNKGGILHAIVGTLIEVGIAILITLPLGVGTAVYMTEVGGRLAKVVRTVVEAMTALPSIVAGLFIYATFIIALGQPKSGLAASLAISVMMLPIIARASDVVLRVVPGGLRQAALGLGAPRWRVVWHVVLPSARSGLATALILGVARAVGETSPVLIASQATTFLNATHLKQAMNSLPLFTYFSVRAPDEITKERGFGAASVLLFLVLLLFIVTRYLARDRGGRR